ncbi:MAG TPA: oligopeptide/dipeptide ABC transporter ATP-binding protein [Usitatibacter sp.]|nr:oligopeptide/dipeptide ABC transporter ATP-binding protein [Usitatibacter sp.]
MSALLEVQGLRKYFQARKLIGRPPKPVRAVEDVSFSVAAGESFALVGESGCGKSTVARCIVGLLEPDAGEVRVNGDGLVALRRRDRRAACRAVQMVFQDPYSSLNPRLTVGDALLEPLVIDGALPASQRGAKVESLLREVGLDRDAARRYPHEFSGGQRQRIGIARALALEPRVLIADEPVSALDVSIQSQILLLLKSLQASRNLSLVFITHDLAVVRNFCDRMAVMYLGALVEQGEVEQVLGQPRHPYTRTLRDAALPPDMRARDGLARIEGEMPSAVDPPSGCRFHPRCPARMAQCDSVDPAWTGAAGGRRVRCHAVPADGIAG